MEEQTELTRSMNAMYGPLPPEQPPPPPPSPPSPAPAHAGSPPERGPDAGAFQPGVQLQSLLEDEVLSFLSSPPASGSRQRPEPSPRRAPPQRDEGRPPLLPPSSSSRQGRPPLLPPSSASRRRRPTPSERTCAQPSAHASGARHATPRDAASSRSSHPSTRPSTQSRFALENAKLGGVTAPGRAWTVVAAPGGEGVGRAHAQHLRAAVQARRQVKSNRK